MMFWVKVAWVLIDLIYLREWILKIALYFHFMFLGLTLKRMLLFIFYNPSVFKPHHAMIYFLETIANRNHVSIVSFKHFLKLATFSTRWSCNSKKDLRCFTQMNWIVKGKGWNNIFCLYLCVYVYWFKD